MSLSVSNSLDPLKSRLPVVSSKSITPAAKTSLRESISSPLACSGDMYGALPLSRPVPVSSPGSRPLLATPKSTIFTSPVKLTTMFRGEMSRCTMPSGLPARSRFVVGVGEARAQAEHDPQRVLERELGQVPPLHRPDDALEVLAVDVLHRDEVRAVRLPDVEGLGDVGVRERRDDARLVQEHAR